MSASTTLPCASSPITMTSTLPLRSQAAFVRALLDELERAIPADAKREVRAQVVEELGRLGSRCLQAAEALAGASIERSTE